MVYGDLTIGLMFISIVIGSGPTGLGTTLLQITDGDGIIGIITIIITDGIIGIGHINRGIIGITDLGITQDITLFGILADIIT